MWIIRYAKLNAEAERGWKGYVRDSLPPIETLRAVSIAWFAACIHWKNGLVNIKPDVPQPLKRAMIPFTQI